MFDKFKQLGELNKMRKQAAHMKKKLEAIRISVRHKNVQVDITGDQKIHVLVVDGLERDDIKDAVNDAINKVQQAAATEMKSMMGFP